MDQIKNKPRVQPGAVATNFDMGQTTSECQPVNIVMLLVFEASFMKRACFWRFLLNNRAQI